MSINKEQLFLNCLEKINEQINKYQGKLDEISGYSEEHKLHPDFDEHGNKGETFTTFEQNAQYLDRAQEMKETLANLDRTHQSEVVRPGSVVESETQYFYISVPLGEINMEDGSTVFALSTEAPIYKELDGKKVGDSFSLEGKENKIVGIQ